MQLLGWLASALLLLFSKCNRFVLCVTRLKRGSVACAVFMAAVGPHFESLLELNPNSAKYLTWTVRVLHGRIVQYQFTDRRNQLVKASKFECVLVSDKAEEYILATVRHNYRDARLVTTAKDRYRDGTVWRMKGGSGAWHVVHIQWSPEQERRTSRIPNSPHLRHGRHI